MEIMLGTAGIPIDCQGDTADGIRCVRQAGLNAMEVEFVRGVYMSNESAKKAGEASVENDVKLSVHAPYYINLCNPEKISDSMKRIRDSCERAHYMGAEFVVFHPGYYSKSGRDKDFQMVSEACREISDWMKGRGFRKVLLGMETTGKKSQFGELDEILEICKKNKRCMPVVDFAHLYARSQGHVDFTLVLKKLERMDYKHYHSHFSGIEYTYVGEKKHVPIKNSKPDFRDLAEKILRAKLNITIICESPLLEKDALAMKRIFSELGFKF